MESTPISTEYLQLFLKAQTKAVSPKEVEVAYNAVAAAMGTPSKRIPAVDAEKPLAHIKASILDEARQRVEVEEDI